MSELNKTEVSAAGFSPHIEDLHEFFRSRGVAFGKPGDLKPFVERLAKDVSFRDEMASMVRAIIYRERDGLMPTELLELMMMAVAGTSAEDGPDEERDAARQMLGFVSGVFRSRWNPGDSVDALPVRGGVSVKSPAAETVLSTAVESAEHNAPAETSRPMTPIFYKAQVVANGGEEPVLLDEAEEAEAAKKSEVAKELKTVKEPKAAEEPKIAKEVEVAKQAAKQPVADKEPEAILPLRGKKDADDEAFLSFAGYAVTKEPAVSFLRGEGADAEPKERRRRSGGWGWAAAILAIIVAFCAGMYTRQWMITRYGDAWPWQFPAKPAAAAATSPVAPQPVVSPGTSQPPNAGATGVGNGKNAAGSRPAQVEAATSAWQGDSESGFDVAQPSGDATPGSAASSGQGEPGTVASPATGSGDAAKLQPTTGAGKPSPVVRTTDVLPRRVGSEMVGASPGLMGNHLLFAPEPEYPQFARLAHVEGTVVVETLVGRDGLVVRARAISGHRMLRGAAEKAVYGRRYRPYVVNDVPMAVRTLVSVDFRLR